MLKVIKKFTKEIDYILENDVELFADDWNGEKYTDGWYFDKNENIYKMTGLSYMPIYRWQEENIDISKLEENTNEWQKAIEIIAFEEF